MEYFFAAYPDEEEYFKQCIEDGRVEINGGLYIQPGECTGEGEVLVRQAYYNQKWMQKKFGKSALIGWQPDTFGHIYQMPQILSKAGMKYFGASRLGWPSYAHPSFPQWTEFWWESPDGSRVLMHWLSHHYSWQSGGWAMQKPPHTGAKVEYAYDYMTGREPCTGFERPLRPPATRHILLPVSEFDASRCPKDLTELVNSWNLGDLDTDELTCDKLRLVVSTPGEFFEAVEKEAKDLPVYKHDFQRVFEGCWAARIEVKKTFNKYAHQLMTAEKLSTLASLYGFFYPHQDLKDAWLFECINQMHDILPDTGIDVVYNQPGGRDAGKRFAKIGQTLNKVIPEASEYLASRVDTSNVPSGGMRAVILFNQLSWPRKDMIRLNLPPGLNEEFVISDYQGKEVPYQIISPGKIIFVADLPSLGYSTYYLVSNKKPSASPSESLSTIDHPLSTNFYNVALSPSGEIQSLIDKSTKQELIKSGEFLNEILCYEDLGGLFLYCVDVSEYQGKKTPSRLAH